jgi:hypothetical protein
VAVALAVVVLEARWWRTELAAVAMRCRRSLAVVAADLVVAELVVLA